MGPIAPAAHGLLLAAHLSFPFLPHPDKGLTFPLFSLPIVAPSWLSLGSKREDVMNKSGLVIFLVLLLSCPILAQGKTNDPGYPVQLASGSLNYQRYGPADCGSEAEGYWENDPAYPVQLASKSLDSQSYGPAGYGSEAQGYWASDSKNYQYGQYGPLGYGTESEGH